MEEGTRGGGEEVSKGGGGREEKRRRGEEGMKIEWRKGLTLSGPLLHGL